MVYIVADVDEMIAGTNDFTHGTYPIREGGLFGSFLFDELKIDGPPEKWLESTLKNLNFGNKPTTRAGMITQLRNILGALSALAAKFNYKKAVGLVPKGWFGQCWGHVEPQAIGASGCTLPGREYHLW